MDEICLELSCLPVSCVDITPECNEATCTIIVDDCQVASCTIDVVNGECSMLCPIGDQKCNVPFLLEVQCAVCKVCEFSVESAPEGGSMRFYRHPKGAIAVPSAEGDYVVKFCCLEMF